MGHLEHHVPGWNSLNSVAEVVLKDVDAYLQDKALDATVMAPPERKLMIPGDEDGLVPLRNYDDDGGDGGGKLISLLDQTVGIQKIQSLLLSLRNLIHEMCSSWISTSPSIAFLPPPKRLSPSPLASCLFGSVPINRALTLECKN